MQNLNERKAAIQHRLNFLTVTRIRALYRLFFPMGNTNRSREELCAMVLSFLCFENQERFDEWFNKRTKAEQAILRKLAFYKVYPVTSLESETGMDLMSTKKGRYSIEVQINPDFKLSPLEFHISNEVFVLVMPEVLQLALIPFLEPPEYHSANDTPEKTSGEPVIFDNSHNFAAMYELLYETLSSKTCPLREFPHQNPLKLTKKDTATLYRESGFPAFPACDFPVPDSLGLAAAFILCQTHGKLPPEGVPLREIVRRFFFWNPNGASSYYHYAGSYFEGLLVGAYMKKRGTPGFETTQERPQPRQVFLHFLKSVENRDAVTMDEVYSFVLSSGVFRFSDIDLSRCFRFKATSFTVDGVTYHSDYDEIVPEQTLILELITKPLFRAYCFLFCALGCLEITVAEPSYSSTSYKAELRNKTIPVSPYDGIQTFRLTELGKWCLGFTEQMPKEEAEDFEINADPALLYITLRGKSHERQVFLDKIGVKIGKERWTVNAASFASGCTEKTEITERVNKFRALVDEHPAEHWETFFAQIEKNAGAVTEETGNFLVYHIDMDKETRVSLMSDANFRRIARFAEDNLVLVPKSNRPKFLSLLAGRGIGALATPHSQNSPPD